VRFLTPDRRSCSFIFDKGKLEFICDDEKVIVTELHYSSSDDRDENVLIGMSKSADGSDLTSMPSQYLPQVEEWAKNAGIPIHAREGTKLLKTPMRATPTVGGSSGALRLLLHRAWNLPETSACARSCYITIEVSAFVGGSRLRLAKACSHVLADVSSPVWDQNMELPSEGGPFSLVEDVPPSLWEFDITEVKFSLHEKDDVIGHCVLPLRDVTSKKELNLMLWDKHEEAIVGPAPHMPCELHFYVDHDSFPPAWSQPVEDDNVYPCHVFMMTRGTRGDVQPFVALARGMAEKLGWLITICTEVRWKSFVKDNANVSRGKIRFRPSGGDTEGRMQTPIAKWALESKTELMQLAILAWAEAEFFTSATVFLAHVQSMKNERKPVDMIIFGLTVAQVAALISEKLDIPIAGFILQPSCIPSQKHKQDWLAVQDIRTHKWSAVDSIEKRAFTGHKSLERLKAFAEHNWFTVLQVKTLREFFDLPPLNATIWEVFAKLDTPMVIPIKEGTFNKPSDWWPSVFMTDFIFLRNAQAKGLGATIEKFISSARNADAKICLMTFSSMPVARRTMLTCAVKMLEKCKFNFRLIYVGIRQKDEPSRSLNDKVNKLTAEGRFLEVPGADFGALFKHIDCFVIHGGLGTTVEALRMRKPCVVTGPLLLDQRFWGNVCCEKGVGPEPTHIDDFSSVCVDFINGALDPSKDVHNWQKNASMQDWGDESDDGVQANVDRFDKLWQKWSLQREPSFVEGYARRRSLKACAELFSHGGKTHSSLLEAVKAQPENLESPLESPREGESVVSSRSSSKLSEKPMMNPESGV